MSISETVVAVGSVAIPQAPPAVKCDLFNTLSGATGGLVGNIRGLENFGPWVVAVLIAVAVILGLFPGPRRWIVQNIFWVITIIVGGVLVIAAVAMFAPNSC